MSFKKRGFLSKIISEDEIEGHITGTKFYQTYIQLPNRTTFLWDKLNTGKFEQTDEKTDGHFALMKQIINSSPKSERSDLWQAFEGQPFIRGYYFPDKGEIFFYQWNQGRKKGPLRDPSDRDINLIRQKLRDKKADLASALMIEETDSELEMKEFFEKRTNKHIGLVKKYLKECCRHYPHLADVLEKRGRNHDADKLIPPHYEPYVHITWQYKVKGEGGNYELDDDMAKRCHETSFQHCKKNAHHPEFHAKNLVDNPISFQNRDQPSGIVVDATKMDTPSIIEMVSDWSAVYEERSPTNTFNGPVEWAKENINKRWKFTEKQEKLIYEIIDKIWEAKEEDPFLNDEE